MIYKFFFTLFLSCTSMFVYAYDFVVNGICYTITSYSALECQVAASETSYHSTIEIPSKVQYKNKTLTVNDIASSAFKNATTLSKVTLPVSITSLGDSCFYGCTQLTNIVFKGDTTSFGNSVFENCTSLTTLNLPKVITSTGAFVFKGCTSLKKIDLTMLSEIKKGMFSGCQNLQSVIWGNSLQSIYAAAFKDCINLTSLQFKDKPLTSIGDEAFYGCKKLTTIEFGDSLKSIGYYAFADCNFKTFIIPNSVTKIAHCIVSGENLESVTIGTGITELPQNPISDDAHLKSLIFADSDDDLIINTRYGITYESVGSILKNSKNETRYYVKEGLFTNTKIDSLYIGRYLRGNSYYEKGQNYYTYDRTEVVVNNLYLIKPPFYRNKYIRSITFSGKGDVDSLEFKINVYNNTQTRHYYAFEGCSSLESITFLPNTNPRHKLRDKLTGNEISPFRGTFKDCVSLKYVKLDGDIDFDYDMFSGCHAIKNIFIGKQVSLLPKFDSDSISSIYCMPSTPPEYKTDFSNNVYLNCNLYVPEEALSIYQQTSPWNNFWNISTTIVNIKENTNYNIKISVTNGNLIISGKHDNQEIFLYNIDGQLIAKSKANTIPIKTSGLYIVKVGDYCQKIHF